jgi:hypothetical protein
MNTFNGINLLAEYHIQKREKETSKATGLPDWWNGLSCIPTSAIDEVDNLIYDSKNLLHYFFNHKSDACILEASEQEMMEKDFCEFIEKYYYNPTSTNNK